MNQESLCDYCPYVISGLLTEERWWRKTW